MGGSLGTMIYMYIQRCRKKRCKFIGTMRDVDKKGCKFIGTLRDVDKKGCKFIGTLRDVEERSVNL